jgi:alkylhydroperoxidase/carboxymuconolactone decarboxylase family protein YurZ
MTRREILDKARSSFGIVPEWLEKMPEEALGQYWASLDWLLRDTAISSRDKVLVAFGAASAIHCDY